MTDISQFKDESFDAVLCMGAFYHVDHDERVLIIKKCLGVLKPDGLVLQQTQRRSILIHDTISNRRDGVKITFFLIN